MSIRGPPKGGKIQGEARAEGGCRMEGGLLVLLVACARK